jgi:P2 family phage contractile tail tube protein
MAKIEIHRITNANVYLDGQSLLGRAEEVQLPQIKAKMVEHKALGMVGTIEAFAGFEKLEGKWASYYADVLKKVANPFKAVQIQVRGSMPIILGGSISREAPIVALLSVVFKSLPGGNFKQHENVELETDFTAYYMKLTVDGQDVAEIDVLENIYKAGGADLLAQYSANIGG